MSPKNNACGSAKLRGGEAIVCTTGTPRRRRSSLPALLVRALGANTKCQQLARERSSTQAAARRLAENAGVNPPGVPYAATERTDNAPAAAVSSGAPGADSTIGETR